MRRDLIVGALFCLAVSAPSARQAAQQPVFRSALDVVTVDVSVRSLGTPVGGLTAADFVLLDNGVRQTIESVEMEEVPADVSVLIDANEDVTIGVDSFHKVVERIGALLRPIDRLRVTTINNGVTDVASAKPVARHQPLMPFTRSGISSAHDGLASALMRTDPSRRHLIIAITNGIDAVSTLDAATVRDIARQSQAVLHIVQADTALAFGQPRSYSSGRQRLNAARAALSGIRGPTRLFWRPYDDNRDIEVLREAAEATGGALHLPGLFTTAANVFSKVFQDYRRSYLLRYTPQGVAREGWHEITVTVPKYSSYTVHARRGYSIEAPATPPDTSRPFKNLGTGPLDALIDAYNRADYAAFERDLERVPNLATLVGDFRKAGNPWPANPGREAAFVIEMAEAALRSRRPAALDAARDLLLDHRKLVRHPLGPDRFERYWLWTLLASLAGVNQPELAREFSDYALTRFPDEPRFVLARAMAADQSRAFEEADGRNGAGQANYVREVTSAYDAAMRFPGTAAEARVRKAFFLHRIDRHDDALAALDAVSTADADRDTMVGYLLRLIRGRVLEALNRLDEARAAYQSALEAQPGAQSPRVALMRLAIRTGDRPAADALAAAIQSARADSFDPWWVYWLGDYRQYGDIIDRLRGQTR